MLLYVICLLDGLRNKLIKKWSCRYGLTRKILTLCTLYVQNTADFYLGKCAIMIIKTHGPMQIVWRNTTYSTVHSTTIERNRKCLLFLDEKERKRDSDTPSIYSSGIERQRQDCDALTRNRYTNMDKLSIHRKKQRLAKTRTSFRYIDEK